MYQYKLRNRYINKNENNENNENNEYQYINDEYQYINDENDENDEYSNHVIYEVSSDNEEWNSYTEEKEKEEKDKEEKDKEEKDKEMEYYIRAESKWNTLCEKLNINQTLFKRITTQANGNCLFHSLFIAYEDRLIGC